MDEAPVDQSNYVALPAVKEGERAAMDFKISIEEKKKKETESEYFQLLKLRSTEKFKKDAQVAVRVAFGVLAADMVQTRNPDYENGAGAIEEGESKWLLLPSFYYLGGLSIAAIMVIFSAGRNLGETIKESWQGFIGVAIALLFNIFVFQIVPLTQENKVKMTFTLDGVAYYVSQRDFYTIFPIMIAFTFGILILPMSPGTKKFAVGMNLSVSKYLPVTNLYCSSQLSYSAHPYQSNESLQSTSTQTTWRCDVQCLKHHEKFRSVLRGRPRWLLDLDRRDDIPLPVVGN